MPLYKRMKSKVKTPKGVVISLKGSKKLGIDPRRNITDFFTSEQRKKMRQIRKLK